MEKDIYKYQLSNLDDISEKYMKKVAIEVMSDGIKSIAPFGFSGDTFYLYGELINPNTKDWRRESIVSFRNYCKTLEMLITDKKGNFIIYTKINGLGFDELIKEYYRQFLAVKHLIESEITETFGDKLKIADDCEKSIGFDVIESYIKKQGGKIK